MYQKIIKNTHLSIYIRYYCLALSRNQKLLVQILNSYIANGNLPH